MGVYGEKTVGPCPDVTYSTLEVILSRFMGEGSEGKTERLIELKVKDKLNVAMPASQFSTFHKGIIAFSNDSFPYLFSKLDRNGENPDNDAKRLILR